MQSSPDSGFRTAIDTLAVEVVGILSHQRDADGQLLFAFMEKADGPSALIPLVRVVLSTVVDIGDSHTAGVTHSFAEMGIAADAAGVDSTTLMKACSRLLIVSEQHVARALPDLVRHRGWKQHWASLNHIGSRAALFGHRRAALRNESEWRSMLHDPSLPRVIGFHTRASGPSLGMAAVVDVIRAASTRIDRGDGAVIATDTSGTILYWNDEAASLYGWRSAEVLGRNVLDVTPVMQSVSEAEAIMHQLLAGRPWSGRFNVRDKDGRPIQVHVTDIPVQHNGDVVGIVGVSVRNQPN
jgi:PAS domain S-box-containing protein